MFASLIIIDVIWSDCFIHRCSSATWVRCLNLSTRSDNRGPLEFASLLYNFNNNSLRTYVQ